MSRTNYKHFDVVGSFLRPQELKEARQHYEEHTLSKEALTAIEDRCIRQLIDQQIDAGLPYITDGEFRRALWHTDFFWGFNGVERRLLQEGYHFVDLETRSDTASLSGPINGEHHPFVEHFIFVRDYVNGRSGLKQTIPAPAQFLVELLRPENQISTQTIYPETETLLAAIVNAYTQVIQDLYANGCRLLQLDDCTWGAYLSPDSLNKLEIDESAVDSILKQALDLNNALIHNAPDDLVITTHVCRGNYHSHHAFEGGYQRVADVLFTNENVSSFYLEFDDERSGSFEPLKAVSPEKEVVLGLVTSKNGTLESKESVIARIRQASTFIPLERLSLSPQCGFASTEEGNILSESDQWKKVALIKEIAEELWPKD